MAIATGSRKLAKPGRRRDPAATRARLLQVAISEFAAKGYSGARIDAVAARAKVNIRMIYHYFGGKEALYIEVLEHTLAKLRADELKLDFSAMTPLDGIMQLFDFIDGHFTDHPELMKLLSSENLNKARFMQKSAAIPMMATPVLRLLQTLLQRGVAEGCITTGIEPLHLYVTLVSLAYFHKSNAHTLTRIFATELLAPAWQADHKAQTRRMLLRFLSPTGSGDSLEVIAAAIKVPAVSAATAVTAAVAEVSA